MVLLIRIQVLDRSRLHAGIASMRPLIDCCTAAAASLLDALAARESLFDRHAEEAHVDPVCQIIPGHTPYLVA